MAAVLLGRGADPNVQTTAHTVDLNVVANDTDPVERELQVFRVRHRWRFSRRVQFAFPPRLAFTKGDTPLHAAAYRNHPEIVGPLIAHGADVSRTNRWGETALHLAVVCGHTDIAEKLLKAGADPRARTQGGITAVDIAKQIKDKKLVRLLSGRGTP